MQPTETVFSIPGLEIAAKVWGNPDGIPTLALHGWLDNAASFDHIAPHLDHLHLVCLDLPGHGHSSHKPEGTYFHLIDVCLDMIQVANQLGWSRFALLGHSLGAAIASLVAGTLQDRIIAVALIDGLGGLTTDAAASPQQFRRFLSDINAQNDKKRPHYPDLDTVITARCAVCPMERASAEIILRRSLTQVKAQAWTWRSDPRLRIASALQLTREQTRAFLADITAPTLLIRPTPGYPFPEEDMQWRIETIKNMTLKHLPGGHHVHLDNPEDTAALINPFFAQYLK